jgi:hypothetical protein
MKINIYVFAEVKLGQPLLDKTFPWLYILISIARGLHSNYFGASSRLN